MAICKKAEVFKNNDKRDFAPNRFKREEFVSLAKKTPTQKVKEAFRAIKQMLLEKKKEKQQSLNRNEKDELEI